MATNAFGTPTNLNQFNAIVNGSKSNSLVNQLFAGKTSQTTPMVATPNVVAASSQVKSPSQTAVFNGGTALPTNSFGGQSQTGPQSTIPNTMSGTNGAPMSGPAPAPMSLLTPPINQPVTSHSVTDAQGNTVTQKYDTTATDTADTPSAPVAPQTSFTTPSGATVDTNGNTLSSAPVSALSSITSGLVNNAGNNAAIGQSAANTQAMYAARNADIGNQAAINEETVGGQGLLPTAMGRAQQIAQTASAAETANSTAAQAALQGTGQQLTANSNAASALNNAGALSTPSNQFITPSYGSQVLDSNGQPVGGGATGTLPATAQSFVNSLASQVQSGQMTRAAAESELTAYGPVGLQALNTALGSSFNTNASNASANTTATGQQISAAITPANQALDALQTAFNGLSGLQQGNVPLINASVPLLGQLAQGTSLTLGIGRDAASAYQGALNEARSRIDAALAGVIGVDAASAQAAALLPDNMVASEIPQKIAAAKQYLQNQLQSYTNSGNQSSGTSSGGTVTAGGYTFVQDANGNWVAK